MTRPSAPAFSEYVGIPYRDPRAAAPGLHCWELVELVMREVFHMKPPAIEFSARPKDSGPVFMDRLRYWRFIPFDQRRAADLIVLRIAGEPVHCGILTSRDFMLHTMAGRNACLEPVLGSRWEKRIHGVYRWEA